MALNLPDLSQIQVDIAEVEKVVAIVDKYDEYLPVPAVVKAAIHDFDALLKFLAQTV